MATQKDEKQQQYDNYVSENAEAIAKKVEERISASKEDIRAEIIGKICEYIDPVPKHYEWHDDENLYDNSGDIEEAGVIDLNQKVDDFLNNEYTGNRIASGESGHGWYYQTYGDILSDFAWEIYYDIMNQVIKEHLEEKFGCIITNDELSRIDPTVIVDELAAGLIDPVLPIGIGDMSLADLL